MMFVIIGLNEISPAQHGLTAIIPLLWNFIVVNWIQNQQPTNYPNLIHSPSAEYGQQRWWCGQQGGKMTKTL